MQIPTDKYGAGHTLDDGRHCVHFERHLPYPIETIWASLTDPAHLTKWFPGLVFEAKLGGKFEIWFSGECDGPAHVSGEVSAFEPPYVLQLGSIRWELSAHGEGCLLVFTDILYVDERGLEYVSNSVLGGWHKYLDSLERHLDGGAGDPRTDVEVDYSKL